MKGKGMQVYGPINNQVGAFWCNGATPDPDTTRATLTVMLANATELADASNVLRLSLYLDFGQGLVLRARMKQDWQGGPGQTAPTLSCDWSALNPPLYVVGLVENGTRGANSPAKITEVDITFA